MNDIIQHTIRRRAEIARVRVENTRLRAALAWAWFSIAMLVLGVCYITLIAYCKTSRAVRREIKIARMKQALCKLVAGGLHCDVDGVYSTMNVGSVIVSVSLSVPRVATSDNTTSWYVPLAGVSPPSGEISP